MVNVIVAFPRPEVGKNIKHILVQSGYHVTHVLTSGAQVLSAAKELSFGIAIVPYRFKDMPCQELAQNLPPGFLLLAVTTKAEWPDGGIPRTAALFQPVRVRELLSAVEELSLRSTRLQKQIRRRPKERSEEERRLITQAKEILMEKHHMSEPQAHRYLQKLSMDHSAGLVETARDICNGTS